MGQPPRMLLERIPETIQRKHYSIRTETAYVNWIKRYILFHKAKQGFARHPCEMGAPEIEAFLTYLDVNAQVVASTQNRALSANLFSYREVLNQPVAIDFQYIGAKRPKRFPAVLTKAKVLNVLVRLLGEPRLISQMLYG